MTTQLLIDPYFLKKYYRKNPDKINTLVDVSKYQEKLFGAFFSLQNRDIPVVYPLNIAIGLCDSFNFEKILTLIEYLIDNGADPNLSDDYTSNSLLAVINHSGLDDEKYIIIIKLLIKGKVNINHRDINNMNNLLNAIRKGKSLSILKLLIENGANIYDIDSNKKGVLIYSVGYNSVETIKYFLDMGLDINGICNCEYTPLMYAVMYNPQNATILLEYGANMEKVSIYGQNVLYYALVYNRVHIITKLLNMGVKFDITQKKIRKSKLFPLFLQEYNRRRRDEHFKEFMLMICLCQTNIPNELKLEIME